MVIDAATPGRDQLIPRASNFPNYIAGNAREKLAEIFVFFSYILESCVLFSI